MWVKTSEIYHYRHIKISASELYNEEHQAKLIYKDVGFHAFKARWLKDKLVQAKDVKFENGFGTTPINILFTTMTGYMGRSQMNILLEN